MEKLVIYVCVGSSCHLKGSHTIVKLMKKAIANHNLADKVELKATFCLGHCTDGPSVKVGDEVFGMTEETFDKLFAEKVLSRV